MKKKNTTTKKKSVKRRSDILDELGQVPESTKRRVKKQLEAKTDTSVSNEGKKIGRKVDNTPVYFEILDSDSTLLAFVKDMVNNANLNREEFYELVPFDRGKAYNMLYQLGNNAMNYERAELWASVLGYELTLSLTLTENAVAPIGDSNSDESIEGIPSEEDTEGLQEDTIVTRKRKGSGTVRQSKIKKKKTTK